MIQTRKICAAALAALLLLTGCNDGGSSSAGSSEQPVSSAADYSKLNVIASDGVDPGCTECIRSYFLSLEQHDFDAYQKALYPPFREIYAKFLAEKGSTPEEAFGDMCAQFDEDGYESWRLTELRLMYYEKESETIEEIFSRYIEGKVFDDAFEKNTKSDASELHDVVFSLDALYAGDTEPVNVVERSGILAVKNADGWFVFG